MLYKSFDNISDHRAKNEEIIHLQGQSYPAG
jgi:hypothetical protein